MEMSRGIRYRGDPVTLYLTLLRLPLKGSMPMAQPFAQPAWPKPSALEQNNLLLYFKHFCSIN
jgi:hypothetical protein